MISLESLQQLRHKGAGPEGLISCLRPLETALDDIPALAVSQAEASRLKQGQPILLRGRDAPIRLDAVFVTWRSEPIAIGNIEGGMPVTASQDHIRLSSVRGTRTPDNFKLIQVRNAEAPPITPDVTPYPIVAETEKSSWNIE